MIALVAAVIMGEGLLGELGEQADYTARISFIGFCALPKLSNL